MSVKKRIYEDGIKTFTWKRLSFLLCFILFFFLFKRSISEWIGASFLCDKEFSNVFLDTILVVTSLGFSLRFAYKFFVLRYTPGYVEIICCLIFIFCLFFLPSKNDDEWEFTQIILFGISFPYFYLVALPLIVFLLSAFTIYIQKISSNEQQLKANYAEDTIINKIEEDKLGYGSIVNKIEKFIREENFQKSFTIGLVGPWGNGKSSIVNLVTAKLNSNDNYKFWNRKDNLIIVHFLPYLNHREDDIISEFFTSLSHELAKYSGKLFNLILDYSKRVNNLYSNKNILEFIQESSSINIPSKQLYDDINNQLGQIGKKVVVFIDDLDRLNEIEILQVLKLIRNTANFNNTIFIVAMDKDYVLNRLKANNHILDSRFIDKFFQMEVYLPELESTVIRAYFVEELMKSPLADSMDFGEKLKEALNNKRNLFDLHVKNFRDAKRVINQIIFEYPFFYEELDLKDFMNFIYLKLKFPKVIKLLNDNRNELLEIIGGGKFYSLKKNAQPKDPSTRSKMFDLLTTSDFKIDISKYEICYKDENKSAVKINYYLEDYQLLIETLACLFGDENEVLDNTSIKFENNFRKLMQQ